VRQPPGGAARPDTRHDAVLARSGAWLPVPRTVLSCCCGVQHHAGAHHANPRARGAMLEAAYGGTAVMMAAPSVPIVEARDLGKRFVQEADLAERLVARLGS